MDYYEKIEYKKCSIELYFDENPEDPREWDNFGTMICFHNNYNLGDKTDLTSDDFEGWDELKSYLKKEKHAEIVAPLYMYDHSGIRIKIGDFYNCGLAQGHARFDSGQIGFIYVSKKKILEEYGGKKLTEAKLRKAKKCLETEIKNYDKHVSGQVYGFMAKDENGDDLDSCWGFYDEDFMIDEAKRQIDWELEQRTIKKCQKTKNLIKNNVALNYR